jgi:hypothetical protein
MAAITGRVADMIDNEFARSVSLVVITQTLSVEEFDPRGMPTR